MDGEVSDLLCGEKDADREVGLSGEVDVGGVGDDVSAGRDDDCGAAAEGDGVGGCRGDIAFRTGRIGG